MVYRGYYYEKNLCVMITHYNVFRRFFRTIYIVAIIYEQIMNSQLTFRLFAQFFYFLYSGFFETFVEFFHIIHWRDCNAYKLLYFGYF